MPCNERILRRIVEESAAEAAAREMPACAEALAAKAVRALTQASLEGDPLTDVELLAVLATFLSNRLAAPEPWDSV